MSEKGASANYAKGYKYAITGAIERGGSVEYVARLYGLSVPRVEEIVNHDRWLVLTMLRRGVAYKMIAKVTGMDLSVVITIIEKYYLSGNQVWRK